MQILLECEFLTGGCWKCCSKFCEKVSTSSKKARPRPVATTSQYPKKIILLPRRKSEDAPARPPPAKIQQTCTVSRKLVTTSREGNSERACPCRCVFLFARVAKKCDACPCRRKCKLFMPAPPCFPFGIALFTHDSSWVSRLGRAYSTLSCSCLINQPFHRHNEIILSFPNLVLLLVVILSSNFTFQDVLLVFAQF